MPTVKTYVVIYVENMDDDRIQEYADDAMLQVQPGVIFHPRTQLLFVVRDQLGPNIAMYLPAS